MRFEQFTAGSVLRLGPRTVHEDEIVDFAARHDPQWFHTDPAAARRGRFGGLIASGWHTCAIAMRLVVDGALAGSESFASPGLERVRWPHPVRPGDTLRLTATVLEARRARSSPHLGVLRWRWQLHNQAGVETLDLTATSLFDLTPTPCTEPTTP
ncbi:MAG: MaoC family dehydratase [Burkholderiales bacterium]|nr:MaoC family dehydratase [Burkholderiales bacterium]